jgi:GT2 family glycosyltransferase
MLNYNGFKYLKRTIPPLLELDYPNYEFIIVDNGSTDGSLEFVKSFNKIRLLQSPRTREKNFACNYGVNKARGEYILLLDNDILLINKYLLKELIKQFNKNNNIGSLGLALMNEKGPKLKGFGMFLGYYFSKRLRLLNEEQIKKMDNKLISYSSGGGFFIKKSVWQKVGGYDDYLKFGGDDSDLGIKLWLFGYKNYLYSKTIQIHLGEPERNNNKKYALKWKEMFYAHLYTIVKNLKFINMILTLIGFFLFGIQKTIKESIFRKNLGLLLSFLGGYYLFFKNLPIAIKKRQEIQSRRIVKDDIFLRIKPPLLQK